MKTLITTSIICFGFALSSCGNMNNQNADNTAQQNEEGFFSSMFSGSSGDIEFVNVTEPNEQAFSVNVPKGWKADVAMLRRGGGVKNVGSVTSPDGKINLFFGDPNLPSFGLPNPQMGMYEGMNTGNPMFQVRQFVPADQFFKEYTSRRFGNNQAFRILNIVPNNENKQRFEAEFAKQGAQANISTADVIFEYQTQGQSYQGKVSGVCMSMNSIWVAVLSGYTSAGGSSESAMADKCLAELNNSFKTNQQWQQRENQQMAMQSQQRHQQNMQMMQSSFNAHQNRMRANQSSFDSYMNSQRDLSNTYDQANQSWMNNQQSMDRSHENFVDYIRDEQRIGNGENYTKVQSGYDNYYVNQNEGTYIGTNSQFDVAPDGYEQWNPEY
ncbi:MAG: hypothetical protein R2850_01280 [Bacteroidia bacterium]